MTKSLSEVLRGAMAGTGGVGGERLALLESAGVPVEYREDPSDLTECAGMGGHATTHKDRVRRLVNDLVWEITSEALRGAEDAGKSLPTPKPGEDSVWTSVDKAVRAKLNPSMVFGMVEDAKKLIAERVE